MTRAMFGGRASPLSPAYPEMRSSFCVSVVCLFVAVACRGGMRADAPETSTTRAAPQCPSGTSLVVTPCVRDGMVAVPEADVTLGSDDPMGSERPQHGVHVAAFQIDRTEPRDGAPAKPLAAPTTCVAPGVRCGDSCVDVQSDNGACGGCGAVCDGTCFGGRCVVTAASFHGRASGIATNGAQLVWQAVDPRGYALMSVAVAGGEPRTMLQLAVTDNFGPVAVDPTTVYWTERAPDHATRLLAMPLVGGEPVTLATESLGVAGLAVDAEHVFFTTEDWRGGDENDVKKVAKGGGGRPIVVAANMKASAGLVGIALDDARVYVMTGEILPPAFGASFSAVALPKRGGKPVMLPAWGHAQEGDIAIDATSVYWLEGGEFGGVWKRPRAGGTRVELVTGQNELSGVAVDGTSVYWTVVGECRAGRDCDGAIMKVTPK
jgi:hypothetical protein